ncbi:PilZ domain-containing protein [Paenibacillus donghaensis]|uniref:PilZ domain-containing protein n=1 Tax=Paenibacillus donghaensis TaxID=414771 RepID=A0A2Z2K7R7_9BACL|nr:PilZ domain-containing protein [Paenibacillus donghaensis]ASA21174.1 PilZ domain-containing protein [Paenibacillus donghaensis]
MTTNRRTEPFRYDLVEPASFELYILSINGNNVPSKPVSALLHDISRSGCRLSLLLNMQAEQNQIRVGMEMVLHEEPIYLEGTLKWNFEKDSRFHYGVQLDIPEHDRDRLPRELRLLAGERKIIVR